jgi:hypothetical protein
MTPPVFTLQRSNIMLYCRRWLDTVHFYKKQLRLPVADENDWFVEFQLTATSYLSIANSARATISDVQGQGVVIVQTGKWTRSSIRNRLGSNQQKGIEDQNDNQETETKTLPSGRKSGHHPGAPGRNGTGLRHL